MLNSIITSATIFATIMLYFPLILSDKFPLTAVKAGEEKPFFSAFSIAVLTASLSISTPTADYAPSKREAIERIPLPQPMSSTVEKSLT